MFFHFLNPLQTFLSFYHISVQICIFLIQKINKHFNCINRPVHFWKPAQPFFYLFTSQTCSNLFFLIQEINKHFNCKQTAQTCFFFHFLKFCNFIVYICLCSVYIQKNIPAQFCLLKNNCSLYFLCYKQFRDISEITKWYAKLMNLYITSIGCFVCARLRRRRRLPLACQW